MDFVLQKGQTVNPVEIKSGSSYRLRPALDAWMNVSDWNLEKAYVFCQGNIEQKGKIIYLPWYMAMFLEQEKLRENLIVDVDLSGLGY